ncbi:MAG: penicillin-binding transpeptidase domain-containing protein, partial [Ignavibacteria bacterium]
NENYILRAKTGWGARFEKEVGWFVGYIETNKQEKNLYFFVNNIDINEVKHTEGRYSITNEILKELKIIE